MRLVRKFLSLVVAGSLLVSNCGFVDAKKINQDNVTSSQSTEKKEKSTKDYEGEKSFWQGLSTAQICLLLVGLGAVAWLSELASIYFGDTDAGYDYETICNLATAAFFKSVSHVSIFILEVIGIGLRGYY